MSFESIQLFFSSEIAQRFGWCLFHSLWQFALIAFATFAILQWIPRSRSESRYLVSMVSMFLCLVSVGVTWTAVNTTKPLAVATENSAAEQNVAPGLWDPSQVLEHSASVDAGLENVEVTESQSSQLSPSTRTTAGTQSILFDRASELLHGCLPWVVACWVTGVCVFALRPLLGLHAMWRLRRQATSVSQDLQARFESLLVGHSVGRRVELLHSTVACVPTVLGFLRPVVVIPVACLSQLTARELDAILLHELAHLRRYDDWFNLIQVLVETLFFYHPALWWISNQVRIERENCCDDFVVAADRRNSKHLATALLSLETSGRSLGAAQPALHASGGKLLQRVRRLVGSEHTSPGWLARLGPVFLVAGLAVVLFLGNIKSVAGGTMAKTPMEDTPFDNSRSNENDARSIAKEAADEAIPAEPVSIDEPLSKPVGFSTIEDLKALPQETDALIYSGKDQNAFDDRWCQVIAERFAKLRHLDVVYARAVTDKGIEELAKLESLVALRIRFANQVTANSVKAFVARGKLISLDVSYCPAFSGDDGASELAKLSTLKNLVLVRHSGDGMTEVSRQLLMEHKSLERVIVNGPQHEFVATMNELRTDPMWGPGLAHEAPGTVQVYAPFHDDRNYRFVVVQDAPGSDHWKGLSLLGHSTFENDRFRNQIAYEERKGFLAREHKGDWVVIAGGAVFINKDSMDEVCKLADKAFPDAAHRFVFQAGVHDVMQVFGHSPWITGKSNWWQFGRQFRNDQHISITLDKWLANGKSIGTTSGHASIELVDIEGKAKTPLVRHAVCSAMSEHQMAITQYDVEQLGLDRFAIPGTVRSQMYRREFSRTWVKVRIKGLEIEQDVVAFVAPKDLVDADRPVELKSAEALKEWSVQGQATDAEGNPLKGVTIKVFSGIGSLWQSGAGKTDDDGRYKVKFGQGMRFPGNSIAVQAATVYAQLDGYTERNLCRQGDRLMASTDQFEVSAWGKKEDIIDRLILPRKPVTIDFVMTKAAKLEGYLTDDDFRGYANQKLSLTGKDLPPSSSVYAQVTTDENGKFTFANVPAGKEWWLEFTVPNTRIDLAGDRLTLAEGETGFRHVIVKPKEGDEKAFEMKVSEPSPTDRQRLSVIARNLVYGSAVKNIDKRELVWNESKNGLRAAILGMPKVVKIGSIADLKVVVQNTSKETITFESTRWRQDDSVTLHVNDKLMEGSEVWYSGWPRVQTIELKAGEEVTLAMAGILFGSERDPKLTPAYLLSAKPGKAELWFDLKLPDVGYGEEGHWKGTLTTGIVEFQLVKGE